MEVFNFFQCMVGNMRIDAKRLFVYVTHRIGVCRPDNFTRHSSCKA